MGNAASGQGGTGTGSKDSALRALAVNPAEGISQQQHATPIELNAAAQSVPIRGGGDAHSYDSMLHSPPDTPSSVSRSPLLFTPQMPTNPMAKGNDMPLGYDTGYQGWEDNPAEKSVATMIAWTFGGANVAVEGSWDNWTTRQALHKTGKEFSVVKRLQPGVYQYKFIVDGEWSYAADMPAIYDEQGNVNNVLDVHDYVPENLDNLAGFEPPPSPPSSYSDTMPGPDEFAKDPPLVPPHLHLSLLNAPPVMELPGSLPRPQHVILNHTYCERRESSRSMWTLGLSHRYRAKYVSVVLYKPQK